MGCQLLMSSIVTSSDRSTGGNRLLLERTVAQSLEGVDIREVSGGYAGEDTREGRWEGKGRDWLCKRSVRMAGCVLFGPPGVGDEYKWSKGLTDCDRMYFPACDC